METDTAALKRHAQMREFAGELSLGSREPRLLS